jgi:hypothetical protein
MSGEMRAALGEWNEDEEGQRQPRAALVPAPRARRQTQFYRL